MTKSHWLRGTDTRGHRRRGRESSTAKLTYRRDQIMSETVMKKSLGSHDSRLSKVQSLQVDCMRVKM